MPATNRNSTETNTDNAPPAPADNAPAPEAPEAQKKKKYVTHWSCSKLQGNDDEHTEFAFPTLTPDNPVELNKEEFEAANLASINSIGYRLREVV